MVVENQKLNALEGSLETLYKEKSRDLLFHGWHHITFVQKKAIIFAKELGADQGIVEAAALTHDLNYVAKGSHPSDGKELRETFLKKAGYSTEEIEQIEAIVLEEHTAERGNDISGEAKALSDADTLFKALPFTPILFASKYIAETQTDIVKLASKIVEEQNHLMEQGIYFYTESAREKYLGWAKVNLQLWNNVAESLRDPEIQEVLDIAKNLGVL